jgi:hypothetical protein
MGSFVALHNKILVGQLDLTSQSNRIDFGPLTRAMKDSTTFADGGYTCVLPGLISGTAGVKGNQDWAAGALDATYSISAIGSQYPISTIPCPTGTVTAGDAAYMSRGVLSSLDPLGGTKGELGSFDLGLSYDTVVAQAKVGGYAQASTIDGNGTAVAMAGPTASQSLYAALHVTAYSGLTNVVFKVQSDDNGGFSSATDRITFTTVTAIGSEWKSVAGSFSSETHLRVNVDVTGSGSVTWTVVFGVI